MNDALQSALVTAASAVAVAVVGFLAGRGPKKMSAQDRILDRYERDVKTCRERLDEFERRLDAAEKLNHALQTQVFDLGLEVKRLEAENNDLRAEVAQRQTWEQRGAS